ncbi:hypothetical protein [Marinobacter sp. X15-166B]|uniref:hypothetical protein n=1 Tax=Marinobacter sp. X15-166B TaxID=1897620 RepID=UPI00085BD16B|nr:hypothetical protein [Marinobacter sp. X15-166B]OEY66165.1 hypothetical protein BG841_06635 [Marinobacter sp. X15-166B]
MAEFMNHTSEQPGPEQIRRGRRMAVLLFTVGLGPMVVATLMYYTGWLNPSGHTNHGVLITPPLPVAELQLTDATGAPLEDHFGSAVAEPRWLMIVVADRCADACESLLYLSRQVNIALGKNAHRVARSAYLQVVPAAFQRHWQENYPLMQRLTSGAAEHPRWPEGVDPRQTPRVLLVDPLGNVMMHYGTEHSGKAILEDLKHLLKLSQIG